MAEATYTPEDFEKAHNEITRAYFQAVLEILFLQGHGDLNYLKKTVELPDGGIYLLQIQHVTGPRLNVQDVFAEYSRDES